MSKLKFNDLPKILDWIKEPSHAGHLFILEQALKSVQQEQYKLGTKVTFGRPNGRKHLGVVIKLWPKKAVVDCNGAKWRVPYDLMKVVEE